MAVEGGSDTLLRLILEGLPTSLLDRTIELVPIPSSVWSYRRHPVRYLWMRFMRRLGTEIPVVDLRALCRRQRLDAAYFAAPAFAHIDIPFVFTVWDLGHRTVPDFPEMRSARDPWTQREALFQRMVAQAGTVIVGNQAGAEEVCRSCGVERTKVAVLPFPNPDFSSVEAMTPAWQPARPFFLYPAQLWPHKNHYTLLESLARPLGQADPLFDLVFVGSDKGNTEYLKAAAAALGVGGRVHFAGFVPRRELKALYEHAAGLVFSSLLGPNNLPLQEAAVLGCPAIVSDLPGHREQLREGALYVPPMDAGAWSAAMRGLLNNPALRPTLVARAREAVAGCTLEAYAVGLSRVFAELAARRGLWA